MKALVLSQVGQPLERKEIASPQAQTGETVVKILAAPVLSYMKEVLEGTRPYPLVTPLVPGCGAIGEIVATGPDATKLKPGDRVFCDPTVRSRDGGILPDEMLQGLFGGGEGGQILQTYFRNGSFAEHMMLPLENALPLFGIASLEPKQLCALNTLLVPYGGLLAAGLQAGETVLINGASGHFGSAAVAVALAMGAGRVVATARQASRLEALVERFGDRVKPAVFTGDESSDLEACQRAGGSMIDSVLDILPPVTDTTPVRTALRALRPKGVGVLMGGILHDVHLPYSEIMLKGITLKGQFMYPREAPRQLFGLIEAGLLSLEDFTITSFGLEQYDEALTHASNHAGAFQMTVFEP